MRLQAVIAGSICFVSAYYGLGVFVESSIGYYFIGVVSTIGFLLIEQRL